MFACDRLRLCVTGCVCLCVCVCVQYLLKYNDVKTKRGVDLGEHLLAYYQAQEGYFKDGSTILNALKTWESKFKGQLSEVSMCLSL